MNEINSNIILNSIKLAEEKANNNIPEGYIEINLSTKGKLGAPKVFHIRNFKVREIATLSLTTENDLPRRLIQILNDMIYEDSVNVANFHEKEVEELMILIYANFFKSKIENVVFPIQEEDMEYAEKNMPEDMLKALKEKTWKPFIDIDIVSDLDQYEIPDDFNSKIKITNKKTGFFVEFDYMKYGDRLIVKDWLNNFYAEKEAHFKKTKDIITYNNNVIESTKNFDAVIPLEEKEEEEYRDFINEKFQTLTEISRLVSIVNFNGQDVSNMSLSDKYELMANDARIDYGMILKLSQRQSKIPFGIKPEVKMINPITGKPCTRRLSFRIPFIIQAIQLYGDSEYDDGYDDEDRNNME